MDDQPKRTRSSKSSKINRKSRPTPLYPIKSGELTPQFSAQSPGIVNDRLNDIINDITSEGDDAHGPPSISNATTSTLKLVEPPSPPLIDNRSSIFQLPIPTDSLKKPREKLPLPKARKSKRFDNRRTYSPSQRNKSDDQLDSLNRRPSIGECRRQELTNCMEYYRNFLEIAQHSNAMGVNDDPMNSERKKQYATTLWYELKRFFNGSNSSDENGLEQERRFIDSQRKKILDEFDKEFTQGDFENLQNLHDESIIKRRHLSECHLEYCHNVKTSMENYFSKWDQILSFFPSFAALENYDKRFDPRTKEGARFYEKMSVFQAWYNLYSEINRLIAVLGRIMGCINCMSWPNPSNLNVNKSSDSSIIVSVSHSTTPSSVSSNELKDVIVESPSNVSLQLHGNLLKQQYSVASNTSRISTPSSFISTPDVPTGRRLHTISSMASMDNMSVVLTAASSLTDYYYRYIDDQLTHARIELLASIFRLKHGPLLQRLRYTFRKEQTISGNVSATTFDSVYKNHPVLPENILPSDFLIDAKPDKLIDEFFTLNKQLQQIKNPNFANKKVKKKTTSYSDVPINILNRFEQNPTLTSSTFPPVSAPTLVLKLASHDRSIIKRQSYFLDYLDPTLFPHLPGSTLFPDPCTFLDNLPFNSSSQLTNDESILISKMLNICYRLYDKQFWNDCSKFSDMFELFHLPSLYPQYVFLVQIPLDLMLAWQVYHQDRKMEQTSTTGALLLLIDECKILIHSATLVRQYIKIMVTDVFEKPELKLIENDLITFDRNIIDTMHEIVKYIENYIDISMRSHLFHNCIILLRDQWKALKKYSTMMNMEQFLGEKFLNMFSNVIKQYHEYINICNTTVTNDQNRIEHIKKKIYKKYQKKLMMDILREAKAIYEDCALTTNIYLQKPVCRRFLLILKTAGFERIKFATEPHHPNDKNNTDNPTKYQCSLFAPAEYFEDNATKLQLARTLSSSFRVNTNNNSTNDSNDEQTTQTQQPSPTTSQQASNLSSETNPPLVYVLCVPILNELESEWRGVTHTIPSNKNFTSILPLNTNWKTTAIFLLTQQTNQLEKFEELFRERLSKTHVQQNDLYNFDTKTNQTLQKRSCFEEVDRAMFNLARSMLSLSNSISQNVKNFESLLETLENKISYSNDNEQVEKLDRQAYTHTEERAFAFSMDVIRETSYFATQLDNNTLMMQAKGYVEFADTWLNFVRKKKSSTNSTKNSSTLPMWLLPGIHFLRHICSLQFTVHVPDEIFEQFSRNVKRTMKYLHKPNGNVDTNKVNIPKSKRPSRPSQLLLKDRNNKKTEKKMAHNTRMKDLEIMDRNIDRQRFKEKLIGRIKQYDDGDKIKMPFISQRMEQDLAYLKIRNFHKLNLLSHGQYATTYKCTVKQNEVLCYKQYKIQHNDAQAIANVLEQLVPLMHITHENLIKYRGIALEHDHILFFMEYCSYGTIAQALLGTSSTAPSTALHIESRRQSISLVCSLNDTSSVNFGIIQTTAGFAFFEEHLVQHYLKQLLSALSCLHEKDIIHRDIRNVNIFFKDSTKQTIKLGDVNFVYDFKFMKKQSSLLDMEAIANIRESIVFYAPETITQNETTTKSDIWSLGCTLVHMLSGRIPWSNPSIASSAYYWKVVNWVANGVQPSIPTDLSLTKNCIDFLEKCFKHDPNSRPSSHELLQHPFVTAHDNEI